MTINREKPTKKRRNIYSAIEGFTKVLIVYSIGMMIYLGYFTYNELQAPNSFESWIFLSSIIFGSLIFAWCLLKWDFPNFSPIGILVLFVAAYSNQPQLFRWAFIIIGFSIVYEILVLAGLEIKPQPKFFWRGKRI